MVEGAKRFLPVTVIKPIYHHCFMQPSICQLAAAEHTGCPCCVKCGSEHSVNTELITDDREVKPLIADNTSVIVAALLLLQRGYFRASI